MAALPAGARGLDFGCGPGSALAAMLGEAGFSVALYDPLFAPDRAPLDAAYDFVTATEVLEHLHRPAETLDLLDRLVRPGGWLGVMTGFQTDDARFADWHYRRDATHVTFYRADTLAYLARQRGYDCTIPGKDVALWRKPG
jgi:2-polyprenyl-3-methyl-5-hydroxy-6-metoxy-1,4-benzoquinol methylase